MPSSPSLAVAIPRTAIRQNRTVEVIILVKCEVCSDAAVLCGLEQYVDMVIISINILSSRG